MERGVKYKFGILVGERGSGTSHLVFIRVAEVFYFVMISLTEIHLKDPMDSHIGWTKWNCMRPQIYVKCL